MAYVTVTVTGPKVGQDNIPGRPTSYDGHFEWTFILIQTREDFNRLVKTIRAAAPRGSMVHRLEQGEIVVHLREAATNDHEIVQAVGNAIIGFGDDDADTDSQ